MAIYDNSEQIYKQKCIDNLQELINYINDDVELRVKFHLAINEIYKLDKTIENQNKQITEYKEFFKTFKKLTK